MINHHSMQRIFWCIFTLVWAAAASNLANPAITLPEARMAVGVSYHIGGYSLTNDSIPALFNRIHGRVEFGPIKYLTLGIDAGVTQIEVDRYSDTAAVFHGKFGFSGGAHLKLASPPFAREYLTVIAIAQATMFNSVNKFSAAYGGKDGCGVVGIQVHLPGFGYLSIGPQVYLIQGTGKSYNGESGFYSNTDNIRGWCAIDYFPKMKDGSNGKPYVSLEFSASPSATYSKRIPVQGFSVSVSIGSITKRLYGTDSDIDWTP
jgi:hypothetical protein